MEKKFLHFGIIFKGTNMNYGESSGNVLSLKKLATEGKQYSYVSRQALRYDIVRLLEEEHGYGKAKVGKEKGVIQFLPEASINDYAEIDFFGYMKTEKKSSGKIRKAVVRLTDAVSLEPFSNEIDFSTNKGLADRTDEGNDIYQSEIHTALYAYSVTVDLSKIGEDENDAISIEKEEKSKRMQALLASIKLLYRDIRGKRENLAPLFIIGGLYASGNPFFYNRFGISFRREEKLLQADTLNATLKTRVKERPIAEDTEAGAVDGVFSNLDDLEGVEVQPIEEFFSSLSDKVASFYLQ